VTDPSDSPGKPVLVDSSKNFIKIQWEKPKKDGGAPIQGYNVERRDARGGTWVRVNEQLLKVGHIATSINHFLHS